MKTASRIAVTGILLFVSTMPLFAAGIGTQTSSVLENVRAQGPRGPYTDGGRVRSRDPYTDSQNVTQWDVYTGDVNAAQRDVYTNRL